VSRVAEARSERFSAALAELLWRQGRPYGVRDGVVLSGIRFEASEVVKEAQSRGVESSGGERIEWKIIGDFTSCFIHELAFLQTANEPIGFFRPELAFSGLFSCGRQTANEPLRQGEPRAGRLDTPLANLSTALRESESGCVARRENSRHFRQRWPVSASVVRTTIRSHWRK